MTKALFPMSLGGIDMGIRGLLQVVTGSQDFSQVRAGLQRGMSEQAVVGLVGSQKASYIAGIYEEYQHNPYMSPRPLVVITYSSSGPTAICRSVGICLRR